MIRKKAILLLGTGTFLFCIIRLSLGVYIQDEFGDRHLFIKHRPIWKWTFYSPIGMSDLKLEDLSAEMQDEQKLFHEFVTVQGLSH